MGPPVKTTIVTKIREYEKPVLNVLALALAFVIAMLALKSLKSPATENAAQSLAAGTGSPTLAAASAGGPGGELPRNVPERAIPASTQMRERVAATVEEQPEVAARLLRSWMKE